MKENIETEKVATEVIRCDASYWIKTTVNRSLRKTMSIQERKMIESARERNWQIYPGMTYIEEQGEAYGKSYISNYIKELHELCLKYELYTYML